MKIWWTFKKWWIMWDSNEKTGLTLQCIAFAIKKKELFLFLLLICYGIQYNKQKSYTTKAYWCTFLQMISSFLWLWSTTTTKNWKLKCKKRVLNEEVTKKHDVFNIIKCNCNFLQLLLMPMLSSFFISKRYIT